MASTTVPGITHSEGADQSHLVANLALVLVWSEKEPWRIGEVMFLPPHKVTYFGRGDGEHACATCGRHRPGEIGVTSGSPLDDDTLSRLQLEMLPTAVAIEIKKLGRCRTLVNGEDITTARLVPGDTLFFKGSCLFVCVRRPLLMPIPRAWPSLPAFGEEDRVGSVGESAGAWGLRSDVAFVASIDDDALVTGESGTGKEHVVKAIHLESKRANGPCVNFSGPTLTTSVLALELFGRVKGAVNAQEDARPGLLVRANGGTLFLDEVDLTPPDGQAALLRALESKTVLPVMGAKECAVDVRVVGATSRDVNRMTVDFRNRFKARVHVPALRERAEDVPLLIRHLMRKRAEGSEDVRRFMRPGPDGKLHPRLSGSFVDYCVRHPLQGNMRELERILIEAMRGSAGDQVRLPPALATSASAPPSEAGSAVPSSASSPPAPGSVPPSAGSVPPSASSVPRSARGRQGPPPRAELLAALKEEEGNLAGVARRFGVERPTVYRWMEALGITRDV